jgi:hypothetical protein
MGTQHEVVRSGATSHADINQVRYTGGEHSNQNLNDVSDPVIKKAAFSASC